MLNCTIEVSGLKIKKRVIILFMSSTLCEENCKNSTKILSKSSILRGENSRITMSKLLELPEFGEI